MREYSDLFSTALAAAVLAAAVLLSPWLTRALTSSEEHIPPVAAHASHGTGSESCDRRSGAAASAACAVMQKERPDDVVTAGASKTF